jgi:hypothetical protein
MHWVSYVNVSYTFQLFKYQSNFKIVQPEEYYIKTCHVNIIFACISQIHYNQYLT